MARVASLAAALVALLVLAAPAAAESAPDAGAAWEPQPQSRAQYTTKKPADAPDVQQKVVDAKDGTDLFVETWLPEPLPGKVPTILIATPYMQEGQERYTGRNLHPVVEWFNARGYAVAQHHIRGTGNSGGCLEQTAANQIDDVARVIAYLGGEAPWSNGAVGMYGISYDAEAQISTAGLADPTLTRYLRAIIPATTVAGQYEYSFFDGVPYLGQAALSNAGYLASVSLAPGEAPIGEHTLERFGCQPELMAGAADQSGDMTPVWASREYRAGIPNIRAATLWIHGLADRNVQPIALAGSFDRLPDATPHKALFGQWEHNYPDNHSGVQPDWAREDWLNVATAWYDRYLKGLETGVDAWPDVQVQDSTGQWRAEPSFPQAGGPAGHLGLAADGQLGGVAQPSGSTTFTEADESQDNAVWETPAVAAPLHLTGQPMLDLVLTTDRPDAHLAARLEVLGPDGSVLVHEGGDSDPIATYGFRSLRHLEPMPENYFKQSAGAPAPTDEPIRVPIRFHPNDLVVPAGGKLRVTLAGSLSYAGGSRTAEPSGMAANITVHHECGGASSALRFLTPHPDAPLLNVRETDEPGPLVSHATEAGVRDGGGLATAPLCGAAPVRNEVLGPLRSFRAPQGRRGGPCIDSRPPRVTVKRRGRLLRGRATDRGCAGRVARVEISVARTAGRRCRFLLGATRLSRPRSCRRPIWLAPRGRRNWKFRVPRGRYTVRVRAVDVIGNVSRPRTLRMR